MHSCGFKFSDRSHLYTTNCGTLLADVFRCDTPPTFRDLISSCRRVERALDSANRPLNLWNNPGEREKAPPRSCGYAVDFNIVYVTLLERLAVSAPLSIQAHRDEETQRPSLSRQRDWRPLFTWYPVPQGGLSSLFIPESLPFCRSRSSERERDFENTHTTTVICPVLYCTVSLVTSLLVTRGLKKECDYGYPIGKQQVGVLPYFVNINW